MKPSVSEISGSGSFNALSDSDESLLPKKDKNADAGLYERSSSHLEDFIKSVRSRVNPLVPVEIGQRTTTCCILGNIALELKRPVSWSPKEQYFINDPEAEKFFRHDYQNGYKL